MSSSSDKADPSPLCRIVGLTSPQGMMRNGSAAKLSLATAQTVGDEGTDTRRPVCIDGFPGPMAVKMNNIDIFPDANFRGARHVSVGVGRGTLLDTTFNAVLAENGKVLEGTIISGGSARSRGNIAAVEKFVARHGQQTGPILLTVTDLNVARALNRIAMGGEAKLAPPLDKQFRRIAASFPRNGELNEKKVMVKFDSHRLSADKFETKRGKLGPQRYASVKAGTYHIYPCPYKDYLDALEVRYADASNLKNIVVRQDIYLDYGVEEVLAYPKHAAALGECDRLSPSILAEVDPQMFWAAVLWLKQFIKALVDLDMPTKLVDEWKDLEQGKEKSRTHFAGYLTEQEQSLSKGADENWGITSSKDQHIRVATDHAIAAVMTILLAINKSRLGHGNITIHTQDFYKGGEIDKLIFGMLKHQELIREEFAKTGSEPTLERTGQLYNKALKSVGLGSDSRFRAVHPLDVCATCGKQSRSKLQTCARW